MEPHKPVRVELRHVDVANLDAEWARIDDEIREALSTDSSCEMRVVVAPIGDGTYRYCWWFNYWLLDGWSISLVLDEVARRHDALCGQQVGAFADPAPISLYHRAVELRRVTLSSDRRSRPEPMRGIRRDLPARVKPYRVLYGRLSQAETDELARRTKHFSATINMMMMAGWARTIGEHCDGAEVGFGTVFSNRDIGVPGIERVVSQLISLAPVAVPRAALRATSELVQAIRDELHAQRAASHLAPEYEAEGRPIFDSYLVYQNTPAAETLQATATAWNTLRTEAIARTAHPLRLEIYPGETLIWGLHYCPDNVPQTLAEELHRSFARQIASL